MQWKTVAAVAAAVLILVAGLGLFQKCYDAEHGEGALQEWFVYGGQEDFDGGQSASVILTLSEDGQVWLDDGEERARVGWVKTGVYGSAASISGTLAVMNQDQGCTGTTPLPMQCVEAGGLRCGFYDVTGNAHNFHNQYQWNIHFGQAYVPPDELEPGEGYTIAAFIAVRCLLPWDWEIADYEYIYFERDEEGDPIGEWGIEYAYSISTTGGRLERQEVLTPDTASRPDAAHMAYSVEIEDQNRWVDAPPADFSASFGGLSVSGTQWEHPYPEEGEWQPDITGIGLVRYEATQHHAVAGVQHGAWSVSWSGVNLDLSRYHRDHGAWAFEGVGGGIEVWGKRNRPFVDTTKTVLIYAPYIIDLSEFAVVDQDGALAADLCVNCPVQASNHYPASLDWATTPDGQTFGASPGDKVYPTIQQLRDVGQYADPANVTGMDHRDPDDQYGFLTSRSGWPGTLTKESVEHYVSQYGHDPEDLRIPVLVAGVNATDLSATPEYAGLLTITHAGSVGIYGPTGDKAHDVEDWVGSGGCTSPNGAGEFTSDGSAGAKLTLALASNYEARLERVPEEVFPTGMPGVPDMYNYRRAGLWRAFDGELDQDGEVWSEPAEACYCADGFSALTLPLTGPSACTLTVALTVTTFAHHDTSRHPGSKRQIDYSFTPSSRTLTYEVEYDPVEGIAQVLLAVPEETTNPELTVVESIEISGFAAGAWQWTAEPTWARDGESSETPEIKLWEGPIEQYVIGGHRAVVDSMCKYALGDTTDDNGGHAPLVEEMVLKLADYYESEPPPEGPEIRVDHTHVYSLDQLADRITQVCNAWTGAVDDDVRDDMCYSADSDAYYSTLYAFNAPVTRDGAHPLAENVTSMTGAIICGGTQLAQGLLTPIRAYKVIGGMMEGVVVTSAGDLARNETGEKVWRRPETGGDWEEHDTPGSNSAGYWRAISGPIYQTHDPASVLYEYGTGDSASSVTSTGRFATREYAYATLAAGGAPGVPWLHWMVGGWLHIVVAQDGVVRYYWMHPFSSAPTLQDTGAHPFGETGGFSNPFITSYSCGWLLAGATDANGMRLSLSRDFGGSWEEIEGTTLVGDLRDGCVAIQDGVLAACGWKGDAIVFRSASGTSYAAESLYIGGPTQATICAAAEGTRSQVLWVNGVLEALVEGVGYYRTRDWGTSWTQVPAPHIADGMTGGTCAFIDGEVLASGIEAGEVRVESAYRDDRTPEAFYIGGPTHIAVVEASVRNAVEAVHGERWVATGEDGLTLYRARNPADGFAKII